MKNSFNNKRRYYLGIEDLVSNILYSFKTCNKDIKKITYSLIKEYTLILSEAASEKDFEIIYDVSIDKTISFVNRNSNLFSFNHYYIEVIEDISIDELVKKYHGKLPMDVLFIVCNKININKLISEYEKEINDVNKVRKQKPKKQ